MRQALVRLIAALVLVVVLAGACDKVPKIGKKEDPGKANLTVSAVAAADSQERPEANQKASEEGNKIRDVLNAYYEAAFINPSAAQTLPGLFTAEAQAGFSANPEVMTLGDLQPRIKRLAPKKQEITKLTVFVEDDMSTPLAVASVTFEATAETKEKADGPLAFAHNATYWMSKEGETYKIYAFSAELKADTETKSGAFGVPS